MMSSSELIYSAFLVVFILYFYIRYKTKFTYWKQRNIKHDTPLPIFGNHGPVIFNLMTNGELSLKLAQKYPTEDFIGYYRGETPELYVLNPKFYPYILNSDFEHFLTRPLDENTKAERMLINLLDSSGDNWKLLRQRLTPAFSSRKLGRMAPLIAECTNKLQEAAEGVIERDGRVDVFELMSRYTIECICSCGFGLDADNILKKENNQFLELGINILSRSSWLLHLVPIFESIPPAARKIVRKIFGVKRINPKVKSAVIGLVETVRKERNFKPSNRNDFIDLLMELECLGKMRGLSFEKKNPDGSPIEVELEMDIEVLAAQVYIFFVAGYATSAIASSVTLHFLAFNPTVQNRIIRHIDTVFAKHDNKITYESIFEMSLLEMAVKEAMRLFPPSSNLSRVCTKKYTFPDTDITIDAGVRVLIPSQVLYKGKYYDNASEFRPERFLPEEASKRPKYTFLAFGEGQRRCIGARLGMMMSMAGVASILQRFTVEPSPNSTKELKVDRKVFTINFVKGGIPLKLVPRLNTK